MNKSLKAILLASGSSMIFSVTGALADNNEAFLDQSGIGNSALIDQSAADNSTVGIAAPAGNVAGPATQNGNDNALTITQTGESNNVAEDFLSGAIVQSGVKQVGNDNDMTITQSRAGGASSIGNMVKWAEQTGDNHSLSITQTSDGASNTANASQTNSGSGADGNTAVITQTNTASNANFQNTNFVSQSSSPTAGTGGVVQNGERNDALVTQNGQGLRLNRLEQTGSDNDADVLLSGIDNGKPGLTAGGPSEASGATASQVLQSGSFNETLLDISGERNAYGVTQNGNDNDALGIVVTGNDNSVGVGQFGDDNEIALATVSGDLNSIGFNQTGNDNFGSASVDGNENRSLISQTGDRNETYLEVDGSFNEAYLNVTGDDNYLNAYQKQRRHDMFVDITGNGNNNPSFSNPFSGAALTVRDQVRTSGLQRASNFRRGDLFQIGYGGPLNSRNSLELDVVNSDDNSFAMYQNGNRNDIVGSISNGNSNQAVVAQIGDDNSASFSQAGTGNNAGIVQ